LTETADNVGEALSDQLLVRVYAILGLGCHRFGDGDGFHEAYQRNHQRPGKQRHQHVPTKLGLFEFGQAGGNGTHHFAAADQFQFALADFLDMPTVTVGFFAGGNLSDQVKLGRMAFCGGRLLENEFAHGTDEFTIFALCIMEFKLEQFNFVV